MNRDTLHLVPQSVSKEELRDMARALFGADAQMGRARRMPSGKYEAQVTLGGRVAVRAEGASPRQALLEMRATLRALQVRTKVQQGGATR